MKTAGIDVGFDMIKVAIAADGKILATASGEAGCIGRESNISELYNAALADAGFKPDEIEEVISTGIGKHSVGFASRRVSDAIALAKAAKYFSGDATSVIDIGADKTLLVTLGDDGITEIVRNQKCMAGLGLILDVMANRLGYTLDEVSGFQPGADKGLFINDGCPVFAELDSLEQLNKGCPKDQVMGAVINTVAVRLNAILRDKVLPAKKTTVLLGGVSRNTAVVNELKARSGIDFKIPEDAVYGSAIGCALLAGG